MSEIDFENELIDNCIKIIEAETKPLSKKPSKNAVNTMAIDKLSSKLSMSKLCTQTDESYLEDMFKTL
mgnify:CR=1 FL=1|tara:strand:- start:11 stop:214 length:204 start_codon:yes stop_codon:yes gene_type:complete